MKVVSFILTVLLFILLINTAFLIYQNYRVLSTFGIDLSHRTITGKTNIIEFIVGFVVFAVSIFLNLKKEYFINTIISSLIIVIYVVPILIRVI